MARSSARRRVRKRGSRRCLTTPNMLIGCVALWGLHHLASQTVMSAAPAALNPVAAAPSATDGAADAIRTNLRSGVSQLEQRIAALERQHAEWSSRAVKLREEQSKMRASSAAQLEALQKRAAAMAAVVGTAQAAVGAGVNAGARAEAGVVSAASVAAVSRAAASELSRSNALIGAGAGAGAAPQARGGCTFAADTDYVKAVPGGGDWAVPGSSKEECCSACMKQGATACVAAVYWQGFCYLQAPGATQIKSTGRWAAVVAAGAGPAPAATSALQPEAAAASASQATGAGAGAGSAVAVPALPTAAAKGLTAVLVICYNRPQYLKRMLDRMLRFHPAVQQYKSGGAGGGKGREWAIVVSQDGAHPGVAKTIRDFQTKVSTAPYGKVLHVLHIQHQQQAGGNGYEKLANHFGWAFGQVFGGKLVPPGSTGGAAPLRVARVITLEDDLLIAPDFFAYFDAVAPLLDSDPTLLAASAYNDNGQRQFVADPRAVLRTECFPGLGWMMNAKAWAELGPKWPKGYWDDWLREPAQRKGRAFLRPEISRTKTYGRVGVSQAQFFDQYLDTIELNSKPVAFTYQSVAYLSQQMYDKRFDAAVRAAKLMTVQQVQALPRQQLTPLAQGSDQEIFSAGAKAVRVLYDSNEGGGSSYMSLARQLGLMADIKAGIPRTAYKTVVTFRVNGHLVHLALRSKFA